MKNSIGNAKNILIVLPDAVTPDVVGAVLGLAHTLRVDRTVTIASLHQLPQEITQVFDLSSFELIHELAKKEVVLTLNREKGAVDDVRWRESDEKIQFIITPGEGNFEYSDVAIETTGSDYDAVIILGAQSLSSIGELYSKNTSFFEDMRLINIDVHPDNEKFGAENLIGTNYALSSWVLELLEKDGFDVGKEGAESLLKGIFWAHEGFRDEDDVKKAIAKFTESGGELVSTLSQMFDTLSVAELRYIGSLVSNMRVTESGMILSKVSKNELQGVSIDRVLYPEINILSRVRDYKIAVLLTEYETEKILVRVYAHDGEKNVFEIFSEFSPRGNDKRVSFELEGTIGEVENRVVSKLTGQQILPTEPTEDREQMTESIVQSTGNSEQLTESSEQRAENKEQEEGNERQPKAGSPMAKKESSEEREANSGESEVSSVKSTDEGEKKSDSAKATSDKKDPLAAATDFAEPEEAPQSAAPAAPGMPYMPPMGGGMGGPLGGTQAPSF